MSELLSAIAEKTLKIWPLMLLGTVPTFDALGFVHSFGRKEFGATDW